MTYERVECSVDQAFDDLLIEPAGNHGKAPVLTGWRSGEFRHANGSRREQMAKFVALRAEVARVLVVRRLHDGNALAEPQIVPLESNHLARVVRDRPNRLEADVEQDLRADAVVAEIGLEAELLIRLDGVGTAVLKLVRLQLVEQADAAPLLIEVDDHAASFLGNHLHGFVELPAAVAAKRMEHVTREALRVNANEHILAVARISVDERDVFV